METNKILSANILDIIFDNKNKNYGAYDLRKTYNSRIKLSLLITALLPLLIICAAFITKTPDDKNIKKINITDCR